MAKVKTDAPKVGTENFTKADEPSPKTMEQRLAEPFSSSEVAWKIWETTKDKCRVTAHIDARNVMDRLDEVFGLGKWQDAYFMLQDGVMCKIKVKIEGEWIEKCDVGMFSEQNSPGDRLKAAFSDALKRCAVKLGIGRYLYNLKESWIDYDPQRKTWKVHPVLPNWALPESERGKQQTTQVEAQVDPPSQNGKPAEVPTQQLGGDAKREAEKPKPPKFEAMFHALSAEDKKLALPAANAICESSGANGSRKTLLSYHESIKRKAYPTPILEYLDEYMRVCWETTPGAEKWPGAA